MTRKSRTKWRRGEWQRLLTHVLGGKDRAAKRANDARSIEVGRWLEKVSVLNG